MKYIQLFLFMGLIYSCNEGQKKEENSETSKGKKELVGEMRVTQQVSTPEFVMSQVKNQNDIIFSEPYEKALKKYNENSSEDFLDLFVSEFRKQNDNLLLNTIFYGENIDITTGDADVIKYLRLLSANEKLQSRVSLGLYETYELSQIRHSWMAADELSKNQEGYEADTSSDDLFFDDEPSSSALSNLLVYIPGAIGYAKNDQDKEKISSILNRSEIKAQFGGQVRFMWGAEKEYVDRGKKQKGWYLYACRVPENGKAKVNERHISKASTGFDDMIGDITVDLSMTDEGADVWSRMSSENVGRIIAIVIDDVVYSAPVVRTEITGGNTQISGNFTFDEANELVELLNGDD